MDIEKIKNSAVNLSEQPEDAEKQSSNYAKNATVII